MNEYSYNPVSKKKEPTGKRILTQKGLICKKQIQKIVKQELKKQDWDYEYTNDRFIYIDTYIFFQRTNMDDDNVYKLLKDSLQGLVYKNDSKALVRTQAVYFDTENPHVDVIIHPVDFIGIFDNQNHLDSFESVCKSCNRYGRNCSILKSAKEGRIQEEIQNFICSKYKEKSSK
jgi:Holliday junction resolvase RusA-like endonuclease